MYSSSTRPNRPILSNSRAAEERPDRILVVDDSRPFRQSLVRFLQMEGFEVFEAENGTEAIHEARQTRPDLVVLDVNMPEMDGFEAVRRIREFTVAPVLMLTCRAAEMDRVLGLTSGADFYMTKPFSASELLVRVHALLRPYRRWQASGTN